ncbi:MAG: hypothetical protein QW261_16080 [Candidatus Jordarchaeaceae archaeon]
MFGKKPTVEKAEKAFAAAYELEKRGNYIGAVKNYVEASELYSILKDKLMEAESYFFAGHCSLLQSVREDTVDDFKISLERARDFWESTRKIFIKLELEEIKPDIRGAIIDSSLILSELASLFEEQDLSKRKNKFLDIVEGLEKCSEIYQKYEQLEKAGIVEFWLGMLKLRNYDHFDVEEREKILSGAIINFGNSEKFLQNAHRERPALCFPCLINTSKIFMILESSESDEAKRRALADIREEMARPQPEELSICEGWRGYNLALIDFNQSILVKNISSKVRFLKNAQKQAEQALSSLLKSKEQTLIADTYFIHAMAGKELVEVVTDRSEQEALLKSAYESLKQSLNHYRVLDETRNVARVLAEIPGVIADYAEFIQGEVPKREVLREGASFGREALEYVKKLPSDFRFLGKLYESMAKYVLMTSQIDEGKELSSEELEKIRDLRSRAFRYAERAVEYGAKINERDIAYGIASKAGYFLSKVGLSDQEKIENLRKAQSLAESAIEIYKSREDDLRTANTAYSLGLIEEDLWQLTDQEEFYRKAKSSFADASKYYTKVNLIELCALCLRKLAELDDRKGNYKMASDYYLEASKKYEQAAENHPSLRDDAKFTSAMYNIELAKDSERKDWVTAKGYYEKALPLFPKMYEHEANFYAAKIRLLEADSVSMAEEGEKAAQLYSSAAKMFRQSVSFLKPGLETASRISVARMFADFAEAREEMERGLIFSKEGKHEAAIVHYKAAMEKIEKIPTKVFMDSIEISAMNKFIEALLELEKAQLGNDLKTYQSAAQLFQECSILFTYEKMRNVSKAYSDLCYGLESLVRCMEAEKDSMQEYINATTYFERSQKFFQETGLNSYVEYLEGMKSYLDGIRYSTKLKLEMMDEAKTSYYPMVEKSFRKAVESFQKSGHIYMKQKAASELDKIKRKLNLSEYLSLVGKTKTLEEGEGYTFLIPREASENAFVILRTANPIAHGVFHVNEEIPINFEITNIGVKTATLERIENIKPPDFKVKVEETKDYGETNSISLEGKTLGKGKTEKITIKIKPTKTGMVNYQPILFYLDENNSKKFFKLDLPILII